MSRAAERLRTDSFEEIMAQEMWQPLVLNVAELEADEQVRQEARRFIGRVALGEVVSEEVRGAKAWTLHDAIHGAARGNHEARRMTETNVRTDVIERTLKAGHVTEVPLEIGEQGEVRQYGQSAADIQANSLRFAAADRRMRARTEAETRNMLRIQGALEQGLLEEYHFVVFSRAADDMTRSEMEAAGFFTDTMSCAVQVTGFRGSQLMVESAFVAGKKDWDKPRHDQTTLEQVGAMLGVDLTDKSATELLDTPLLVHKSLLPNGVTDLVELYDNAAGGTFFGQDKLREDYQAYRQTCRTREASFEPRVQAITQRLINNAQAVHSPQEACAWLNRLSQTEMLEHCVTDDSIDARVFGAEAAFRIEHARYSFAHGDTATALRAMAAAQTVARSSSCPGGIGGGPGGEAGGESDSQSSSGGETEDCEFVSRECPKCHAKNVKTVVKKGKYYGACGCTA
jgi:hypothetical protein